MAGVYRTNLTLTPHSAISLRTSAPEWERLGTPMGRQAPLAPPRAAAHAFTFTKTLRNGKYFRRNTSLFLSSAAL